MFLIRLSICIDFIIAPVTPGLGTQIYTKKSITTGVPSGQYYFGQKGQSYCSQRGQSCVPKGSKSRGFSRKTCGSLSACFANSGVDSTLLGTLAFNVGPAKLLGSKKYPKSTLIRKLEAGDRNIYREYIAFCHYKGNGTPCCSNGERRVCAAVCPVTINENPMKLPTSSDFPFHTFGITPVIIKTCFCDWYHRLELGLLLLLCRLLLTVKSSGRQSYRPLSSQKRV